MNPTNQGPTGPNSVQLYIEPRDADDAPTQDHKTNLDQLRGLWHALTGRALDCDRTVDRDGREIDFDTHSGIEIEVDPECAGWAVLVIPHDRDVTPAVSAFRRLQRENANAGG